MRDFDETSITEAVLDRFGGTPDPRLKRVMQSLVRHLHGFVLDVEPSFEEWGAAVDHLTRTGQMCSDTRQEFIRLSDTLGVSMLVSAINHRRSAGATQISAPGHETLVTHVFAEGDPYLDSDAVFAVKSSLIREFTHEPPGTTPDGQRVDTGWRRLGYDFGLEQVARPAAAAE
jgi:hypothetical protein